jgi:predicted  nucleic acid-binding Zn-ribbon protein
MAEQFHDPEYDAFMLGEAAAINADPTRLGAAQLAAGRLQKEAEEKAAALAKIGKDVYSHASSVRDRKQRKEAAQQKLINSLKS